jgi:hypothetical protein
MTTITDKDKLATIKYVKRARELADELESYISVKRDIIKANEIYGLTIHELRAFSRSLNYKVEKDVSRAYWQNVWFALGYMIVVGEFLLDWIKEK